MPPMTPEMLKYMLEQNIQRWSDNLNVQQKVLEYMTRQALQPGAAAQQFEAVQGGTLAEHIVHTRGTIEAMQNYLTQARAALAQGGQVMSNFVARMGNAGVQIADEATVFYSQHQTEVNTLATGAGGTAVQAATTAGAEGAAAAETAAAAGAVGETTVAAGAIGETTVAAGAIGETTVAAGAIAETTVAAGAVAETTVAATGAAIAETTVAAGTVAAAEAGAGSTIAAGAAGGSWLGPVGIAVGITIAAVVAGGIYVYSNSGDDNSTPIVASSTSDSSSDTDSSSSESDSSSSETTTTTLPPPTLNGTYNVSVSLVGGADQCTVNDIRTLDVEVTGKDPDRRITIGPPGSGFSGTIRPDNAFSVTAPTTGTGTDVMVGAFEIGRSSVTFEGDDTLSLTTDDGDVLTCNFHISGRKP